MRTFAMGVLLVMCLITMPASAQMMGGSGGMQGGSGGTGMMDRPMGMSGGGDRSSHGRPHEAPLISLALAHSSDLGLSAEQQQKLRDLQTSFAKEQVRRDADIRVAEIDLNTQLEQDRWDLGKIEPLVKQIAALRGDLRLARIKTLAAGRAVLTPDQLQKLKQVGHRMGPSPGTPGGSMPRGQSGGDMQHGPGHTMPGGPMPAAPRM